MPIRGRYVVQTNEEDWRWDDRAWWGLWQTGEHVPHLRRQQGLHSRELVVMEVEYCHTATIF